MRRVGLVVSSVLLAFTPSLLPRAVGADGAVVADVEVAGSNGRLREVTVHSPALGRDAGVRVLVPAGFDDPTNADRVWPILWLLHGAGDDHRTWTERTDVEGLTATVPVVVAMPEGGRNANAGWYSDWVDGPAWETFHLRELLPLVESRFRAGGARERRAVAGLSMGGFGAMSYAARHPDLFVAAASFSGAVDTTIGGVATATVFELLQPSYGTPGDGVWGPYESSETTWHGHNPTDLATNLDPVALWLRTGNGVPAPGDDVSSAPIEVGVYPMNLSFHDALGRAGVTHRWFDRGHGTHAWQYWEADLAAVLPELAAVLAAPPAPPSTFRYRFVENAASVFGWTFTLAGRAGPAFTELTGVSASGLTAAGAGTLEVTTPPGYAGRWRVGDVEVDASTDGRLSFTVALSSMPTTVRFGPVEPAEPAVPAPRSEPAVGSGADTPVSPAHSGRGLPATGGAADGALLAAAALVALSLAGRAARRARARS
jgi:S-formylglutathione hydrolase FrmB